MAAQFTLLKRFHVAVFILVLPVTYMRPSELLALRKKNLVPPLVPLFPCWWVVIAASETGASTKIGIRDGSVLVDQCWLQWVNKLLPGKSGGTNLEFRCLPGQDSAMGRSSWISTGSNGSTSSSPCTEHVTMKPALIRCAVSERCKKNRDEVSGGPSAGSSSGGPLPVSPALSSKQAGNTRATCRGIVGSFLASTSWGCVATYSTHTKD